MSDEAVPPITTSAKAFLSVYGLALAPALAYYLAFRYEEAYLTAFGVPQYLVDVELRTALMLMAAILGISGLVFVPLVTIRFGKVHEKLGPIAGLNVLYGPWVSLGYALYLIAGRVDWLLISYIALFVLSVLDDVTTAIRTKPKGSRLLPHLKGPLSMLFSSDGPYGIFKISFGSLASVVVATIIALIVLPRFGTGAAIRQESFLVPQSQPDSVVLRRSGDNLLCCRIDPQSKKPAGIFFLPLVSEAGPVVMERKHVGKLDFGT